MAKNKKNENMQQKSKNSSFQDLKVPSSENKSSMKNEQNSMNGSGRSCK